MIWNSCQLQNSISPTIRALSEFHDFTFLSITFIITYVILILIFLFLSNIRVNISYEAHTLEIGWTFIPILVLIFLALPSLRLLYLIEEDLAPTLSLKTTGNQWYWSYDYADFIDLEFTSYIIPEEDLEKGQIRLLEVDNRIVLPLNTQTRILVTAADVLHSWTIPRLGIKADAVPGRLNQLLVFPKIPGIYYGQCSEICGANHSFMPISLEVVRLNHFINWAINHKQSDI